MFGKKLFDIVTPYKRILLTFSIDEKTTITLPAVNTAVFFLNREDVIWINSLDELQQAVYIDHELIKDKIDKTFYEEWKDFQDFIKNKFVKSDNTIAFIIKGKTIFGGQHCYINCELIN